MVDDGHTADDGSVALPPGHLLVMAGGRDGADQPVRLPKITRWIDLPGEYDGLKIRCWVNSPNRLIAELQSGEEDRIKAALCRLIIEHNGWADDDGAPLPPPTEHGFWSEIPTELAALIIQTFVEAVVARPQSLLAKPAK